MKKVFYAVFITGLLIAFGNEIFKPEIAIIKNEEMITPVEQKLPDNLAGDDSLDMLFYDGKYAVFTTSRDMENQRMVGPASETADIYVYTQSDGIIFRPKIDLYEGVINSAVYDGVNLYYTVYYPYQGRAELVMDDGGKVNDYKVYTIEYDSSVRWDSPLTVETDGDTCFLKQTDDHTGSDVYLINGQYIERFTGWHTQSDSGNYRQDFIIHSIINQDEYQYESRGVYIDYAGGRATVDIQRNNEHISSNLYHYWPGDMYLTTGESIFSLETESPANTVYKSMYISIGNGNDVLKEQIDTYAPKCFATNRKDMTVIHSDDYSVQKTNLITVNGYKVTVQSVDISPDQIVVSEDNAMFMVKETDTNRIFTLK